MKDVSHQSNLVSQSANSGEHSRPVYSIFSSFLTLTLGDEDQLGYSDLNNLLDAGRQQKKGISHKGEKHSHDLTLLTSTLAA